MWATQCSPNPTTWTRIPVGMVVFIGMISRVEIQDTNSVPESLNRTENLSGPMLPIKDIRDATKLLVSSKRMTSLWRPMTYGSWMNHTILGHSIFFFPKWYFGLKNVTLISLSSGFWQLQFSFCFCFGENTPTEATNRQQPLTSFGAETIK